VAGPVHFAKHTPNDYCSSCFEGVIDMYRAGAGEEPKEIAEMVALTVMAP
jgi:hypothetical protein